MDLEKVKRGEIKKLSGANLIGADLRGADLRGANLREADLRYADLTEADLSGVYLTEANLRGAYLIGADLRGADLRGANLIGADLRGANLTGVDLSDADLTEADLRGADLINAYLIGADLRHADLSDADLRGSNSKDIKVDYMTSGYNMACPEKGEFIGYKKADNCLVELLILEDSKRSSATTSKCRCDKAKVLDITHIVTGENISKVRSEYDKNFTYTVGKIVKVDDFDEDRWNECAPGIHFFMNKENAINY